MFTEWEKKITDEIDILLSNLCYHAHYEENSILEIIKREIKEFSDEIDLGEFVMEENISELLEERGIK